MEEAVEVAKLCAEELLELLARASETANPSGRVPQWFGPFECMLVLQPWFALFEYFVVVGGFGLFGVGV